MTPSVPLELQLYNSRIIDTYVKLLGLYYPAVKLEALLEEAGIASWEIADQAHWFSQEQIDRFYELVARETGNPQVAREAGRFAASPQAIGVMRQYILGLVGPANAFALIGQASAKFTRSSTYTSRKLGENSVEIIVMPNRGVREKSFQCENRMGFFEAVCMMFNDRLPHIEHPECVFRGGNCCRYLIRWQPNLAGRLQRLRSYAIAATLPTAGVVTLYEPQATLVIASGTLGLISTLGWLAERETRREYQKGLDNLTVSRDLLMEQLDANYNNAQMSNEIGRVISNPTDIELILAQVIHILEKRLDFDRGLILLKDSEEVLLKFRGGFGYDTHLRKILECTEFHLNRPGSKGVFTQVFKSQKPLLVDDFASLRDQHTTHSVEFARKLGIKSFICCPIICEGEAVGVLAVDNLKSSRPLQHSDMSRLMGVAPVIGVAVRNADLLAVKEKQFHSTLHVLAASIDARDPLTAGHSEKVTEYSVAICDELRLDENDREKIRIAALLHDYGKIGVPDAILKKPGPLTDEEHQIVQSHTMKTRSILERIHFEGNFSDVPEIAGSHHEKFDGSGYPQGLSGEAIPLGARIIAVADFFEAITAKRHYRNPMPYQVAIELLREQKGSFFDPQVVEAFLNVLARHYATKEQEVPPERPKRVRCDTRAALRKNNQKLVGRTRDLSENGIYVGMNDLLEQGIQVQVIFHLPGRESVPIEAWGKIAWVNDPTRPVKPDFPPGCGIAFTQIQNGQEFLGEWLREMAAEPLTTGETFH